MVNIMNKKGRNIFDTIKNYKLNYFKSDLYSGLSVATLCIPQNMAYALIAGLNPIYGLYTSIVSQIISTITGRSSYIIVGPTNLMAMAIASNLNYVAKNNYLEMVILLTFLVGIFQIIAGLLKLGKLVRYVSHPVIVGLTTGAAIIIGVGQINNLLGVSIDRTYNVYMELYNLILNLSSINFISLILGLTTILIIIVAEKSIYKIPSYLLGVLIVTIIVMLSGFNNIINTVGYINLSEFKISIPPLKLNLILNLSTKSLAVAIVGLIQTLAVVKSISHRSNEELDINKEFISQGFMNFGLSFFSGFASSASFTNTFANYQRGAKTRISELLSAIAILFFIIFFNFFIKYIPISSLAALVLLFAYNMIDISEVKELIRATKADTLVFIITFIATISSPRIEYAVYLGVILSLISVLKNSSEPKVDHLIYDEEAHSKLKKTAPQEIADDEYLILDMVGDFNFSSAENFKEKLENVTEAGCGYVLRLRNIDNIDITTINELKRFIKNVQNKDREVLISGINQKKYKILKNLGIIDLVGEDNIFYENANILSSTVDAVEKADKNINGQNDDVS